MQAKSKLSILHPPLFLVAPGSLPTFGEQSWLQWRRVRDDRWWPLQWAQFKWCFQHRLTQFCQKKLGLRLVNHDDDGWVKLATEISHGQRLPSWSPSVFFSKHLQLTPAFSQLTPFLYPSWFFTKYADGSSYLWNYHINGGIYSHPAIPGIYLFGISTVPFEYIRVPCPITMSTGINSTIDCSTVVTMVTLW